MTIYFSKSVNGFYDTAFHKNIPTDAVEISKEKHAELLTGQSNGFRITGGSDGLPVLIDESKTAEGVRRKRDAWLIQLDAFVSNPLRWQSLPPPRQNEWIKFRQDLLDVPQQPGFPTDVTFPTTPSKD